jgi:hypothetical protein
LAAAKPTSRFRPQSFPHLDRRQLDISLAVGGPGKLQRKHPDLQRITRTHRLRARQLLFYATGGFAWAYDQAQLRQLSTGITTRYTQLSAAPFKDFWR